MTTESATVKLSELTIDPSNVRKTGRGEEPKFAASIRARGVLEPMLVRRSPKGGTYLIVNGGERFTALQFLYEKGHKAAGLDVTKDFPVKVEIVDQDDAGARATSLATNLIRADMHPVDEFEAFAQMIKDGATLEKLSAEYARPIPEIRQALSLAAIAPEIRKAWREGTIAGDAAEAYSQTKDLAHQVRVFHKLKKRAGDAYDVTEEITGDRHNETAKLLKFVTQRAYETAGHHVNPSLFAEEDDRDPTVIDNVPALKAMASAKLADEIAKLKKDGWGWVIERDDAPKDIYAWRRLPGGNLPKAKKALAGCTVDISWQGTLEVTKGYIKPGVSVKIEKTKEEKAAARKAGPAKPATISAALTTRLSESLTRATANIVADGDPDMVLRIAVAGIMCTGAFSESPVCLESKGMRGDDDDEMDSHDFPSELSRLAKMGRPALQALFAKMIGGSLDLKCYSPERMLVESEGEVENDGVAALVHFVPPKPLQAALVKEFNADDYFENAPGAMALAALRDVGVEPLKNAKKAALAKQAADAAKKKGWLPPQLRTKDYAGPKAKAAKASRKKRL